MSIVFNVIYVGLLLICSPWLIVSAIRKGKYREGYAQKLLGRAPRREGSEACIWLHAVSVGEVNLLEPLIAELRRARPHWRLMISTTTATGYALACRKYAALDVFYAPLDFSWAVAAALDRVRPTWLILAELEIWPNLVRAARRRHVRVGIINGRLSERSFRGYRRIRPLLRKTFESLDLVAVQSDSYAHRFIELGAHPGITHVTGSLKFDGAQTNRDNARTRQLAALWALRNDETVFLAGSTQAPEEALALDTFRELADNYPTLRLILVPRHPERFNEVAALLDQSQWSWVRRSELSDRNREARILLVDVVGELGAWWGMAEIAFVGGSLGRRGGQNMIEPAAYGATVSFGPNTWNFRDVVTLLLEADAAEVVADGRELTDFVRRCLANPQAARAAGNRARAVVQTQLGAASATAAYILNEGQSAIDEVA